MSEKAIQTALTRRVTKRIKEGEAYQMESAVDEAVTDKLKKSGTINKVADAVIKKTTTIQERDPIKASAPEMPKKKTTRKKASAGDYLRNW